MGIVVNPRESLLDVELYVRTGRAMGTAAPGGGFIEGGRRRRRRRRAGGRCRRSAKSRRSRAACGARRPRRARRQPLGRPGRRCGDGRTRKRPLGRVVSQKCGWAHRLRGFGGSIPRRRRRRRLRRVRRIQQAELVAAGWSSGTPTGRSHDASPASRATKSEHHAVQPLQESRRSGPATTTSTDPPTGRASVTRISPPPPPPPRAPPPPPRRKMCGRSTAPRGLVRVVRAGRGGRIEGERDGGLHLPGHARGHGALRQGGPTTPEGAASGRRARAPRRDINRTEADKKRLLRQRQTGALLVKLTERGMKPGDQRRLSASHIVAPTAPGRTPSWSARASNSAPPRDRRPRRRGEAPSSEAAAASIRGPTPRCGSTGTCPGGGGRGERAARVAREQRVEVSESSSSRLHPPDVPLPDRATRAPTVEKKARHSARCS